MRRNRESAQIHGTSRIDHLPDDVDLLKRMVLECDAYLHSAQQQIEQLKAMLAQLKDRRYGRSSEALDAQIEQQELTLEELESFKASRPTTVESLTPPEPRTIRAVTLASHLPHESVVHEPPVSPGCICPACHGELRSIHVSANTTGESIENLVSAE